MEPGKKYRPLPTTCLQDQRLARRRGRSPGMLCLQGKLKCCHAAHPIENSRPAVSSVFTTLRPITFFSPAPVAAVSTSLVSRERIPGEGRMADNNALSSSDESSSGERGAYYGLRRENHVQIPDAVIEILVHMVCRGREENPVKRRHLFQAICQCIKKIYPSFLGILSDPRRSYERHPYYLQMFENLVQLTRDQIDPSFSLDLVTAFQRFHPDIPGGDERFSKEFRVHGILGKGGFGVVLKAENILDTSLYAVKIVTLRSQQKADFGRVIREVQSLAKVQHKGIVKYNSTWIQPYDFQDLLKWSSLEGTDKDYDDESSSLSSSCGNQSVSAHRFQSPLSSHTSPVITEILGDNTISSEDIVFEDSNPSGVNEVRRQIKALELKDVDDDKESSKSSKNGQELVHQNCSEIIQKSHSTIPNVILTSKLCLFIQMELCGDSLDKWIRSRNEMCENGNQFSVIDFKRNETILLELFEAVEYMHSKNVIHRDLKPANIMFDLENKHIKLGDFGLSRHSAEPTENMGSYNCLTPITDYQPQTTGVGTKVYIAPEQLTGTIYDAKSDMYSLGIITLELCQPFSTESEKYVYISALKQRKPLKNMKSYFIHPYLHENLPHLASLITRLTEPLPINRPSAGDVLRLLRESPRIMARMTNHAPCYEGCLPGSKSQDGFRRGVSNAQDANSIKESHIDQDGSKRQDLQLAHNADCSTQYSLSFSKELYYANLEKMKYLENENFVLKAKNISLEEENSRMHKEIETLKCKLLADSRKES